MQELKTGEELYEVYKTHFAQNRIEVDQWEDLDEHERYAWEAVADYANRDRDGD